MLVAKYDDFSLTPEGTGTEVQSFGVAGYVDLGFGHYLVLVTKRELAVHVSGLDIWRVTGIQVIPTERAPLMTLDEVWAYVQWIHDARSLTDYRNLQRKRKRESASMPSPQISREGTLTIP